MASNIQQGFPKVSAPFVDGKTLIITSPWYQLLITLWNRTFLSASNVGIVAAGTRIDTATPLKGDWNEVGTVPSNSGVVFPTLHIGQEIVVINAGANALNVYPDPSYSIDALAQAAPYVLAAGKMQVLRCVARTRLRSMQLG
jgi:hypothetical protein